ncbi:MAG: hypothetical protein CME63_08270 [Halobacteriovoraceae bacterium]|nr:hypothetical protein [Halobacteriovoraceae bacterium]|tara:strand:- start:32484 stop:33338 length:855 start_codon:yes stop_codon:yes gene_type:complete
MKIYFLVIIWLLSSCSQLSWNERSPSSGSFFDNGCFSLIRKVLRKDDYTPKYVQLDGRQVDIAPIEEYIKSSLINKKLRNKIPLNNEEREFLDRLKKSLNALPNTEGISYRKLEIDSRYNSMEDILSKYSVGNIVEEDAFTSVALSEDTRVWGDILRADIIFEIKGKRLKNISDINELENEGIFLPGTRFRVVNVEGDMEYNPTVIIEEEESIAAEIQYYTEYYNRYSEYFQEYGNYASDFNQKFVDIVDDEYGDFTPVEMDNWEDLIRQRIVPIIRIELEEID